MPGPPEDNSKSPCAREISWQVLCGYGATGSFAADLLDQRFRRSAANPDTRRLATQITMGTIRRQLTLDTILAKHVKRPRENTEVALWQLLRIGAYQVLFMATASHAAVNETVNVTHRNKKSHWSKMVNGVLRSITRSLTEEVTSRATCRTIPTDDGRYLVYDQDVFADPVEQPSLYLSQAFGFPEWLVTRWLENSPPNELAKQLFWFNKAPSLSLRINRLKTTREEFQSLLKDEGIMSFSGRNDHSITLGGPHPVISQMPGYDEGLFTVQDEAAMAAAELLNPQAGENVLDLCAAPGTKTTHIAELMNDEGTLLAADVDDRRLDRIQENASRLNLECVRPTLIDRDSSDIPDGPFDAVLVDVPCSNTGVLARRPEARWRLTEADIVELSEIQRRLLTAACERVKPGGRIVYSTCSIDTMENQDVVRAICDANPRVTLVSETLHLPGQPADGAYQALLSIA